MKAKNELEKLKIVAIDNNNWVRKFGEARLNYATHYHTHVAYSNYPVINITKVGAELYCAWLTEKINKENPGLEVIARLPFERV